MAPPYWAAVSRFKESDRPADPIAEWSRLRSRYPESVRRVKQMFSEDE
jgi:hypothetical protein